MKRSCWASITSAFTVFLFTPAFVSAQTGEQPAVKTPQEVVFQTVSERARTLASNDYSPPKNTLPETLDDLTYTQYTGIRHNPEFAHWRNEALFEIQPFHPGFLFKNPVKINVVEREGMVRSLKFKTENFIYDKPAAHLIGKTFDEVGFSGFRVHYPMIDSDYKDEVIAFQGASYFRMLSPGQNFGLSARGIAINTGETSGEEFPQFTEFWILKPTPEDTRLVIFALLDSRSLTGAYQFVLTPGSPTELEVTAQLHAREDIQKLGVAPLTSMYLHGENSVWRPDDYRPEVHDSDGLLLETSAGEWIWRPLSNPKTLHIVALSDTNPKGFGLMQRDQAFSSYLDQQAAYHKRPSLWVEPINDWGQGHVELVEIPTNSETNDNIVAYWVPQAQLKENDSREYKYRLLSTGGHVHHQTQATVLRTLTGWAALPGTEDPPPRSHRQFVVDFTGEHLGTLKDNMPIEAKIESNNGKVYDINVIRLPDQSQWRVAFKLEPESDTPVDMRLFLTLRGQKISEVWNYVWSPNQIK